MKEKLEIPAWIIDEGKESAKKNAMVLESPIRIIDPAKEKNMPVCETGDQDTDEKDKVETISKERTQSSESAFSFTFAKSPDKTISVPNEDTDRQMSIAPVTNNRWPERLTTSSLKSLANQMLSNMEPADYIYDSRGTIIVKEAVHDEFCKDREERRERDANHTMSVVCRDEFGRLVIKSGNNGVKKHEDILVWTQHLGITFYNTEDSDDDTASLTVFSLSVVDVEQGRRVKVFRTVDKLTIKKMVDAFNSFGVEIVKRRGGTDDPKDILDFLVRERDEKKLPLDLGWNRVDGKWCFVKRTDAYIRKMMEEATNV